MNTLDRIFQKARNPQEYIGAYFEHLSNLLKTVDLDAVAETARLFLVAKQSGKQIIFIGNGGSATTADHFATDLLRCSNSEGRPVSAISLCSNTGIITATSNDWGYEYVFTRQLGMIASSGDMLVAISASGNSSNIVSAINWAEQCNVLTIGMTGFDGGAVRNLVDISLHVQSASGDYGVVEDVHPTICHMVAESLREDGASEAALGETS